MISETDALSRLLDTLEPLPVKSLPAVEASGHYTAEPIFSPAALPRFDQSAMDGYALRAADTPGSLRVIGEQPAGIARDFQVGRGEAARIFTGAPLPAGADAVVMQEDVSREGEDVVVRDAIPIEEFVRRRGADVCEGQCLLSAGDLVTPSRIGLLHSVGLTQIKVHRRARVALLSTGDELRADGCSLKPGELYDANGPMLAALLRATADIAGRTRTSDNTSRLAEDIRSFADADVLVVSAGVSVGEHDPVRKSLHALGAELSFWRVAVKPGKPFLCARLGPQWIFALPGNPVSAFVTALLFVLPSLKRLAGARPEECAARAFSVRLGTTLDNPDPRPHYIRAIVRDGTAFPTPLQQSHALASLAVADVLIRVDGRSCLEAGESVRAISMNFH